MPMVNWSSWEQKQRKKGGIRHKIIYYRHATSDQIIMIMLNNNRYINLIYIIYHSCNLVGQGWDINYCTKLLRLVYRDWSGKHTTTPNYIHASHNVERHMQKAIDSKRLTEHQAQIVRWCGIDIYYAGAVSGAVRLSQTHLLSYLLFLSWNGVWSCRYPRSIFGSYRSLFPQSLQ